MEREIIAQRIQELMAHGSVDLHLHSTFSDGKRTVFEIADKAVRYGLYGIALTDHDTMEGTTLMAKYIKEQHLPLEFVHGIECSAGYHEHEIHILGYFTCDKTPELSNFFAAMQKSRRERNERMLDQVERNGYRIDRSYFYRLNADVAVWGRVQLANYLISQGYFQNVSEAFLKLLGNGKAGYVKRTLIPVADVIHEIHNACGIAVMAHPQLYGFIDYSASYDTNHAKLEKKFLHFKEFGLDGIECFHGSCPKLAQQLLYDLARKHNFIYTQGSDCHGDDSHADMFHGSVVFP